MTNRIGDRPQFPLSNQRFDKGDANNISRYYEEIISRFTGSIYGQAWGCMSNPSFTVVPVSSPFTGTLYYIRPQRCVLMYSMPADGTDNFQFDDKGPWNATIVQFDPVKPGQPVVSLATLASFNAGQRPWILFRRNETDTNVGNKAYWNTSTNTEDIGAEPLQRSEYVEFRLSTSYSSSDRSAGWHRCAYIDSWGTPGSSQTPVIVPIHWMDSLFYNQTTPPVQGTRVGMAFAHPSAPAAVYETGFDPTRDMPELGKLMHWVTGKLGQHYSTTNVRQLSGTAASSVNLKDGAFTMVNDADGGWLSTPSRGLVELDTDLTFVEDDRLPTIEQRLTDLEYNIEYYRRTTRLLHTLYVTPVGDGSPWTDTTFNVVVCSQTNILNSFSPNIRAFTDPGPALGASDLVYQFVPLAETGKKTTLTLSAGTSFILTSVNIIANDYPNLSLVGREFVTATQNYMTPASPITMPPGRYLQLQFVIDSGNGEGSDEMRPFTVHIYGRNV